MNDASKFVEVVGASTRHGCCCCCCCMPPASMLPLCSIPAWLGSMPPPSTAWLASWLREGRPTRATDVPHDASRRPNDVTPKPSQRAMLLSTATDRRKRLAAFLGRVFLRRSICCSSVSPATSLGADGMACPTCRRQEAGTRTRRKEQIAAQLHLIRSDMIGQFFSLLKVIG